jgi:hypothetical protein
MNENERRKRMFTAQGLAALALFASAHAARAATTARPDAPTQAPAAAQVRAA